MVLGKASEKGKLIIKKVHQQKTQKEPKKWAINNSEKALMLASEHQFRNAFAKKFEKDAKDDNADIPAQDFLDWINDEEVFVQKGSRNRKELSSHEIVTQYVNQEFINESIKRITLVEIINDLIKSNQRKVRFYNITNPNWRRFLNCEEEIDEDIFAAFWYALGIEEDYQLFFEKIKDDSPDLNKLKIEVLVSQLTAFNHLSQIKVVQRTGINNYKQAFLMVHKCPWRKNWILRRIQHEIKQISKLKVEVKPIHHKLLNDQELVTTFNRTYSRDYLSRTLNNSYLFLIMHIDGCNSQRLEGFIQNCWQRVLEKNNEKQKGKILLFLVAEKLENNWQNSEILQPCVKQIELTPFTLDDLEYLILSIASNFYSRFNQKILKSDEEALLMAKNLLKDCIISGKDGKDINTVKLLDNISKIFNFQLEDLIRLWKTYPPK